jgi:hypothetical protein
MKRLARAAVVCLCALMLAPAKARADDGGWWDNFWKFDTRFRGWGSEIHLLCLDAERKRVIGCEEKFVNIGRLFAGRPVEHDFKVRKGPKKAVETPDDFTQLASFSPIKHELDFRFSYHQSIGTRYPDDSRYADPAHPEPIFDGRISAEQLVLMYHYHFYEWLAAGFGGGVLRVHGADFNEFYRGVIQPVSVLIYPIKGAKAFYIRPELYYIPKGFTSADFGDAQDPANPSKPYSTFTTHGGELNISVAVGFDLRHVGLFRAKPANPGGR